VAKGPTYHDLLVDAPLTFQCACWRDSNTHAVHAVLRVSSSNTFSMQEFLNQRIGGTSSTTVAEAPARTSAQLDDATAAAQTLADVYVSPGFLAIGAGASAVGYQIQAHQKADGTGNTCEFDGTVLSTVN
jgi:hypothetical protein